MRFAHRCDCDCVSLPPLPNPDPKNYKILDIESKPPYLLVRVEYPDATNLEGIKVLLLKETIKDLCNRKELDPHFKDDAVVLARFHPQMWELGIQYLDVLLEKGEPIRWPAGRKVI